MKKNMFKNVTLAMIISLIVGGAVILTDDSFRPNPELPQKVAEGTVTNDLKNPAYVNQKLAEVKLNLLAAQDVWDEASSRKQTEFAETAKLIGMTGVLPVLVPPVGNSEYSMTYIIEVDFSNWDNELRATHLPEVTLVSDDPDRQEWTITSTNIIGRGCNDSKYLLIATVVSDKPLSEDHVHTCVASGSDPGCAIYADAYMSVSVASSVIQEGGAF